MRADFRSLRGLYPIDFRGRFSTSDSVYMIKLPPESVEDGSPDLRLSNELDPKAETANRILQRRRGRVRTSWRIVPLSDRQALEWCVKMQIPECFRGYFLEAI